MPDNERIGPEEVEDSLLDENPSVIWTDDDEEGELYYAKYRLQLPAKSDFWTIVKCQLGRLLTRRRSL